MNYYGLSTNIRAKVVFNIVLLSVAITYLLNVVPPPLSLLNFQIVDWFLETLRPLFSVGILNNICSVGFVYWILSKAFNDYLWRLSPFKNLTNVCDLNGVWRGELESTFRNNDGNFVKVEMTLVIKQSWTEMTCKCQFPKSFSKSDLVWLKNEGKDDFSLQFSYSNQTREKEINTQPYHGFNILDYEKDGETEYLNGLYFTDRFPQTRGSISLRKEKPQKKNVEK